MIKAVHGSRGTRYLDTETRKFVKKENVPEDILKSLQPVKKIEVEDKKCIFCGAHTNWSRLVNNQTVYICEEHYYDKTIGKIAERLRNLNGQYEQTQESTQKEEN